MLKAAIDIGSNSVRLALSDGTVTSVITKLADGMEKRGSLSPSGVMATVSALEKFSSRCRELGCEKITAFATEAVRRAADGEEFMRRVLERTGLEIKLLSPQTEAALALAGATKPDGAVTVCDLGGGSMEIISSADGIVPDYVKSLPLGVVVLKNRYDGDYRRAIDEMPSLLAPYGKLPVRPLVLGGGSACALAAGMLDLKVYDGKTIDGARFATHRLDDFMPIALSPKLAVFRPVCERRADTLPYGAIILRALAAYVSAREFFVSDSGNLQAVLNGALDV